VCAHCVNTSSGNNALQQAAAHARPVPRAGRAAHVAQHVQPVLYSMRGPCPAPSAARAQDVLKYYGATAYGDGPEALGQRSPRESFNLAVDAFQRERGSYQQPLEHP